MVAVLGSPTILSKIKCSEVASAWCAAQLSLMPDGCSLTKHKVAFRLGLETA